MGRLYLLPVEQVGAYRGPRYLRWRMDPGGLACTWSAMDYGFLPSMLVYSPDIGEADHAWLVVQPGVYCWPESLGQTISPQDTVKTFLEGINIPTDWTTPGTTYLELLRALAGMFQFMQRYGGISGGDSLLGGGVTLATRVRQLSAEKLGYFLATVESFGFNPALVNQNSTLRQLLKTAADYWMGQPFHLGGLVF